MRPDDQTYLAIHKLIRAPEFQAFMAYLEESLRKQDAMNRFGEGAELHQGQGRSQLLQELIDLPAEAKVIVSQRN